MNEYIYGDEFSKLYNINNRNSFAENLFQSFMDYCTKKKIFFSSHLDLACGTGVFCIKMAQTGISSTGMDISEDMLARAEENAKKAESNARFFLGDMTEFSTKTKFDLITCTFNAINHLENFESWKKVFHCTYTTLSEKGLFLFDVNTLSKLNDMTTKDGFPWGEQANDYKAVLSVKKKDENHFNFLLKFDFYGKSGVQKISQSAYSSEDIIYALKETGFIIEGSYNTGFIPTAEPDKSRNLYILCRKP